MAFFYQHFIPNGTPETKSPSILFDVLNNIIIFVQNIKDMKSKGIILLPKLAKIMEETGENIKLARLRRNLTMEQVSERAGISRSTLWQIEKGSPSVSFGVYAQVLFVLGLEKNIFQLAGNDILGRKLQDAELLLSRSSSKR